jgi:hypothetical protein
MLLLALAWGLCVICPASAMAADVSSSYVTGITTDGTSFDSYSTVNCTLSFSTGSGNQLHPGDTISVSWAQTTGTAAVYGYSATLDIMRGESDVKIGTATVTEEGVTITFNDNVDDYQNVSGSVTFSLKVENPGTSDGTVTISSGNESTTITVAPNTASTESPVYKTGDWSTSDSNVVYWSFRVNRGYGNEFTGDVRITDPIPSGLTYAGITAIHVYSAGDQEFAIADDASSIATLMDELGITADYDSSSSTLTVTISRSTASTYFVYFEFATSVSGASSLGASVTNAAIANYGTDGDAASDHSISETLSAPSSSAGSEADDLGTITVIKRVKDTTVPISGVSFRVYKLDGGGERVSSWYDSDDDGIDDADHATITTDPTGVASLSGLVDGYYELEEVSGPDWVVLSDQNDEVTVESGGTASVTVYNSIKTTDVSITKEWDDDGDAAGVRPSAEEFASWLTLLADGEAVDGTTPTVVDNGDGTYTVTYSGVHAYDTQGNEITYAVSESIPAGYACYTSSFPSVAAGGTLVNSYVPGEDGNTSTGDGGTSGGGSDSGSDPSAEDDEASAGENGSSDASGHVEPATMPATGDSTQSASALVVAAGALVALSRWLRRRAR